MGVSALPPPPETPSEYWPADKPTIAPDNRAEMDAAAGLRAAADRYAAKLARIASIGVLLAAGIGAGFLGRGVLAEPEGEFPQRFLDVAQEGVTSGCSWDYAYGSAPSQAELKQSVSIAFESLRAEGHDQMAARYFTSPPESKLVTEPYAAIVAWAVCP